MFTSLIIGQPAWARSIPFIANVFDYVNENLIVKGQFTPYVTNINETVQSNGIGITITEIYCDGENYLSVIKSIVAKAFLISQIRRIWGIR